MPILTLNNFMGKTVTASHESMQVIHLKNNPLCVFVALLALESSTIKWLVTLNSLGRIIIKFKI